jgi:serine/threonine protein kinase/Tol biopolymer transport system component
MIGKTLAHYEITSQIGKGGMGEVYQATDTKLGRDVAIKVLPEEFAQDTDRVARFQREAKLLASLNHPNIAAIYGLEESDGTNFLVMELVEGQTLAERIQGGPVNVEETLKLGLQIAEALEAAHDKGVIHRDLKPANIKVTPDGKVKVLDFGLAKAFAGEQDQIDLSQSPTLSDMATQQGVILGTAAYMPPEQAKGKPVDKRADVWAFGVVLFEMLTGRSLFTGETSSEILAAVIKSEPEWNRLPQNLHPRIRLMLERCLEKDVKSRSSGIGEVRADIDKVLADPSGVFAQTITAESPQKKLRTILPWVAAAIVVAGVVGWFLKPAPPPEPRPVMQFEYDLPKDQEFAQLSLFSPVTISKDGTKIAYVANGQLYLRDINQLTARPIQGTDDGPITPFFSPKGQWIGYLSIADGQLKKIAITGGTPVPICDAGFITGASWGEDDTILFSALGVIMQVSANGGTPEAIVKAEENERFVSPQILPDGKSILFTVITGVFPQISVPQVFVQSLKSGERKNLYLPGSFAQYLPTGHLVYAVDNNLFVIPFDLDRLEITGGAVPMVEGVFRMSTSTPTFSAISDSGTLVYIPGRTTNILTFPSPQLTLVWVDQQGKVEEIDIPPGDYVSPRISPDGTKVAVTVNTEEASSDIHIWDLIRETPMRLTFNEHSTYPLWTPDGQRVVFLAGEGDERGIYWKAADGRGKEELLALVSDGGGPPWSWADDGKTLVTTKGGNIRRISPSMMMRRSGMRGRGSGLPPSRSSGSEGSSTSEETEISVDIGTMSMEGNHEWKPLLNLEERFFDLQISPDGRWMAYSTGQLEAYVRPFPDVEGGGQWQVPTDGAIGCLWSPNGRELIYFNMENLSIMVAEVETDPTFNFGKSKVLFTPRDIGLANIILTGSYDIHPNGERFLMLKEVETAEDESQAEESTSEIPNKIIVVTNWFEELKEKVPVD